MDSSFERYLHWSFHDEHVLFSFVVLSSFWEFLVAVFLIIFICLIERLITFALEKEWAPSILTHSHIRLAFWRTLLYSFATFFRLSYMLVAMTFHMGLILAVVLSLSAAQFIIELERPSKLTSHTRNRASTMSEPLLSQSYSPPCDAVKTRPRSRSKPDDIFIHPAQSNIARADAVALEMGLTGDTDRVKGHNYTRDSPAWETGQGRDKARELLLGSKMASSTEDPFFIAGGSDSE